MRIIQKFVWNAIRLSIDFLFGDILQFRNCLFDFISQWITNITTKNY